MNIRTLHVSLFFLLCFVLTSLAAVTEKTAAIDRTIISFIQGFENPLLTDVMKFFTFVGSFLGTFFIFLVIASTFLYFKYYRELIIFSFVIASSPIFNQVLKQFFQRERPEFHRLIEIDGFSFPSGHTMNAASLYGIIILLLWKYSPNKGQQLCLVLVNSFFIFSIAFSRIYLGAHYPSDIIGGIFASGFLITIAIQLFPERQGEY